MDSLVHQFRRLEQLQQQFETLQGAIELQLKKDQWLSAKETSAILGSGISPGILRDRAEKGAFTYGREYINTSEGAKANYVFKPSAVEAFFLQDVAKAEGRRGTA